MIDFLLNAYIRNEIAIIMSLQFLVHKSASYYVSKGQKSFKGFVKFLIGKDAEPKV